MSDNDLSQKQIYHQLRTLAAADDPRLVAALAAYEDARVDGLCHDGAWECALAVLCGDIRETS